MIKGQISLQYLLLVAGAILLVALVGYALKQSLQISTPTYTFNGTYHIVTDLRYAPRESPELTCIDCSYLFLSEYGGSMKGDLNMDGHNILNVDKVYIVNPTNTAQLCLKGVCIQSWKEIGLKQREMKIMFLKKLLSKRRKKVKTPSIEFKG